jgi:TonB family protein
MRTCACCLIVLLWVASSARAQPPSDVDTLLALPPSPGVEALLLPHVNDPRVSQRWRAALAEPSADRRAAAARMLGIAGVRTAVGSLMRAVGSEQEVVARGELLRALAIVGNEKTDQAIYAELQRDRPLARRWLLSVLAALRGDSVVTHLLSGAASGWERDDVAHVQTMLLEASPEQALRLERGVSSTGTSRALAGVLRAARTKRRGLLADTLMAGVRVDRRTAAEVLGYVAEVHGATSTVRSDTSFVAAYVQWREGQDAPADALHRLVLQLVDRWVGRPNTQPLSRDLTTSLVDDYRALTVPLVALSVLSNEERAALVGQQLAEPPQASLASELPRIPSGSEPASESLAYALTDVPDAVHEDLLRLTGCSVSQKDSQGAHVVYRPDGRPASVAVDEGQLPRGCDRYLQTLLLIAYGPPDPGRSLQRRILLRLDEDWLACRRTGREWVMQHLHAKGGGPAPEDRPLPARPIKPPQRLSGQPPVYPAAALKAGVEGVVLVEARLAPGGCVSDLKVLRSIPELDLAAMAAVSTWRYSETRIDGRTVPVFMTVTVNFSLK